MTADPFATHLPVLHLLGARLRIEYVLEIGAGFYSTPTFLDRQRYPHLKMLISDEPSEDWRARLRRQIGFEDARWSLVSFANSTTPYGTLARNGLGSPDLIFIDSGETEADRVPVIAAVAQAKPSAVVVIHDFEREAYRLAAAGFDHVAVYNRETPHTAILWNGLRPEMERVAVEIVAHQDGMAVLHYRSETL